MLEAGKGSDRPADAPPTIEQHVAEFSGAGLALRVSASRPARLARAEQRTVLWSHKGADHRSRKESRSNRKISSSSSSSSSSTRIKVLIMIIIINV